MNKKDEENKLVKKLTKKQLDILFLVFCFRFVNVNVLADYYDQKYPGSIRRLLEVLRRCNYLDRNFNALYKLEHRPAEYFATTKAIPLLRKNFPQLSVLELHQLYNRSSASTRFIARSLAIFKISNLFEHLYGDRLSFTTKPLLNIEKFDYFPKPLPDAFITLDSDKLGEHHFFAEYFDDGVSIGIHSRKIVNYMKYKESGEWNDTGLDFPAVIIICQSPALLKQAEKRVRYLERQELSGIAFRMISMDELEGLDGSNMIYADPIEQIETNL